GRIEVYDDHALFRPDGSADVVSVSMPPAPPPTTTTSGVTMQQRTIVYRTGVPPIPGPGAVTGVFSPFGKISSTAAIIAIVETVISAGLAIFLAIAGILVLRDARSGRRLHLIYATLKIPLIIIGSIGSWVVMSGWMNGAMTAASPGSPPPP